MERKRIEWTEEKSNRLYGYVAENPPLQTSYFGYQVGRAIVNFLKYFVHDLQNKKIMDYGCGLGHLCGYFLDEKIPICGMDMSPENVKLVNDKFSANPLWGGGMIYDGNQFPFKDNTFDVITCTEVIEHILPKYMNHFFEELHRVLKKNGVLLLTTPNNENFSKNEVLCPECNTLFHKHGHCNKFTIESLSNLMKDHGYETAMCNATNFWLFQPESRKGFWNMSIKELLRYPKTVLRDCRKKNKDKKLAGTTESVYFKEKINSEAPNLFWVGTVKK